MPSATISLLTDFGYKDHYAGVIKGVILGINPRATIVDISHNISPQNVAQGAYVLSNAYPYFPSGTIHVAIVDPGVGTARKGLIVRGDGYFFVGPDNGIFGLLFDQLKKFEVFELTDARFFLKPLSVTFHGRDVFAPVAAYLSKGVSPLEMGRPIRRYQRLSIPEPTREGKKIKGEILYCDSFGNLITNIKKSHLPITKEKDSFKVKIGDSIIRSIVSNYQDGNKGEMLALLGSSEFLEIAVRDGNAQKRLKSKEGDAVVIF